MTGDNHARFRAQAKKAARVRHAGSAYCIEGRYLTLPQLAAMAGVHDATMRERFKAAAKSTRPITFSTLGISSSTTTSE